MCPKIACVDFLRKQPLLLVDLLWIEDSLGHPFKSFWRYLAEETGWIAFVTRSAAALADPEQKGVAVAIDIDRLDLLNIAALLPFAPKLSARATIVDGTSCGERFCVAFGIHPGEHQHSACFGILSDCRKEAAVEREVRSNLRR